MKNARELVQVLKKAESERVSRETAAEQQLEEKQGIKKSVPTVGDVDVKTILMNDILGWMFAKSNISNISGEGRT